MAAPATPYDFAAFEAAGSEAEQVFYTEDELAAACSEARQEALAGVLAEEARMQNALLREIADSLNNLTGAAIADLDSHKAVLADAAADIVSEFCVAAALKQETAAALECIHAFLNAAPDAPPAVLSLSQDTVTIAKAALEKHIAERGAGGLISIEADAGLAAGDMTLRWRGGAMERRTETAKKQIEEIFAATKNGAASHSTRKEQTS